MEEKKDFGKKKIILDTGDMIYLKKDVFGWRIIHPSKNEDGSINWLNLLTGGKRNLFFISFLMVIVLLYYFGTNQLIGNYREMAENPCDFCSLVQKPLKLSPEAEALRSGTNFNISLEFHNANSTENGYMELRETG